MYPVNEHGQLQRRKLATRAALILFGIVLALPIAEIGIRVASSHMLYRVVRPNLQIEHHTLEGAMPGISGPSHFTTDEYGIRGDPYTDADEYHILTIGGSTTEVLYLDDSEAWPYLVQGELNHALEASPTVWVGNIGRSGIGLVEHIHALRYFVPQFDINAVVIMVGINDLMPFLNDPASFPIAEETPENLSRFLDSSFYTRPIVDGALNRPFPENLGIYQARSALRVLNSYLRPPDTILIEDSAGNGYFPRREALQSAPQVIEELPDLSRLLETYQANLLRAIEAASAQGLHLILVTQPAIYRSDMSDEAQRLLWMGYLGNREAPAGRYDPAVLAQALDQFNQRLLAVCAAQEVDCFDLAESMNGDARLFYDDVHFNEDGSQHVAQQLSPYLLDTLFAP
jgi:lysophospholipase L1-like esterase